MTTFILKKYEDNKENITTKEKEDTSNNDLLITIDGSISEIIIKALYKALDNNIEINEQNTEESNIKVISTENINKLPLDTFNSIQKNDIVFIYNRGFKTSQEEWFLTNIFNKTNNIYYTLESFINFIKNKFNSHES